MLYEFNIMSTSLPKIKNSNMMRDTDYMYASQSTLLSFEVPACPKHRRLEGLIITFQYTTHGEDWVWFAKISTSNGVNLMYNPRVFGKPDEVGMWSSYWPIGKALNVEETVIVSIIVIKGLLDIHWCGANLVYTDEGANESLQVNQECVAVLGDDFSEFQLSTGAYYLCRRDFFELMEAGKLTPDWFRILVDNKINYIEVGGWRMTGKPGHPYQSYTELKTIRCIMYGPEMEGIYKIAELLKSSLVDKTMESTSELSKAISMDISVASTTSSLYDTIECLGSESDWSTSSTLVGWDESTGGERRCPTPPFYRPKRPRLPGMPGQSLSSQGLKSQSQGFLAPMTYLNNMNGSQMDFLDSSSSVTSVCVSQNDLHVQNQIHNQLSSNSQPAMQDDEVQNVPSGVNITNHMGMPLMILDPLSTKDMVGPSKDFQNDLSQEGIVQPELSSSMVSQSFGVPDMSFNPIESNLSDSTLLSNDVRVLPPQQFQRLRKYVKVYKHGPYGISIDISAYTGYEGLKQDLARRFGIEGLPEDQEQIGGKLVYMDRDNNLVLVGDDPWEEFVSCVQCIKIFSPQEIQQMSLDEDFGGNSVIQNQACSSSDGGNV